VSIAELSAAFGPVPDGPGEDRLPPQDLNAEQSVLGGMLLSKDAIADCVEGLRAVDFYRPAHELIYDAILDLYGRGEPADAITVADELSKRGQLQRIGGQAYLHQLIQVVPTAANAGYYAQIVAERAVLRRLVEAGTRIVQMGYAQGGGDVEDVVNAAQAEVYAVVDKRRGEDYARLSDVLEETLNEIEVASGRSDQMLGVPTGFIELDELTHGLHPGQMIVVAARPAVGKSTLGLDVARAAAIKHHLTTALFSLEMSRTEITMRVLSAEAQIQLQDLRKGTLRDEGWQKLARIMGQISESPLFIDDSPNMSLMEIRAKCRRLKQQHNLKLVIIDYLQLMTSGKKVESRQQEVAEFSRALKLLAKELEVPVIAISQLNRGPEQRTDKRPQMSDLRESGCLPASTRILRADTGAETTLGELYAVGAKDIEVWSLDDGLRLTKRTMTQVFSTGTAPVFGLTLASGKQVRATENHPFLCYEGWRPLASLRPGDRVAVPRHVPSPRASTEWDDARVAMLGHALGAGRVSGSLGLDEVPPEVFSLPKPSIALLLGAAWSAGGMLALGPGGGGAIRLALSSRLVAEGLSRLLLRFGICCTIAEAGSAVQLSISECDSQRRFLREIGLPGRYAGEAAELLARVEAADDVVTGVDASVWSRVGGLLDSPAVAEGACSAVATSPGAGPIALAEPSTRQPTALIAAELATADLDLSAINDVEWDCVVSIALAGVEEVFDATVLDCHNFVANGIAVHNSIEQDADVVILLHRDRSDPTREGEADVIVAKHRNGPTKDIVLAFQGHYSRFANMAQNF
jgi:replicative DNA helicase